MLKSIRVENCGSIILLRPLTKRARKWLEKSCACESWQWFGEALAVEPRMVGAILKGALEEGL